MIDENIFLLHAFLLGIFITFVYDLLRILRRAVPHRPFLVSAEDLAFWIFCAVEVFLLLYRESNGNLRWFAVLGAVVGMLLYRRTLSGPLVKYVSLILEKILGFLGRIGRLLWKPVALAGRGAGKLGGKLRNRRKRFFAFLKKRLTISGKMLRMVLCKH